MRAVRLAPLLAAAVAVVVGAGAAPARASDAPSTRLLVVGDSISHGWGGDWTWRYWLWREVQRQGARVDFVGPRTRVAPAHGTRYERTWWWDSAHASLSGATTSYFQSRITGLVADHAPDVLLVELGTNDVAQGADAATVTRRLKALIASAWSVRPGLPVVLAQIPNLGLVKEDATSAQVNAALAAWALGKPVTVAHNRTGEGPGTLSWSPAAFTFDRTHPNATGQTLYAHRFGQALHRMGVLPQPVGAVYHARAWSPDARPEVVAGRGWVQVGWRTSTTEVDIDALRVTVDGTEATPWITTTMGDTQTVRLALPPGSRRVQLVPRRGTMTGLPGQAVTVSVT